MANARRTAIHSRRDTRHLKDAPRMHQQPFYHPFLVGEMIYLRGLEKEDIKGNWFQWFNNQEVTEYMLHGAYPSSEEQHLDFYKQVTSSSNTFALAIIEKRTNRHVGNISLHHINWLDRRGEVSIIIGEPDVHGRGYGTEAIRLVAVHAFERLNLHKLWAGTHADNIAAIKAFQKAGFHVEARLKGELYRGNQYHEAVRLAILAEEFWSQASQQPRRSLKQAETSQG